MKITVLAKSVGGKFSSLAMVLLRHAEELRRRGHAVTVIVPADRGDSLNRRILRRPNVGCRARKLLNRLRGGRAPLTCAWADCAGKTPIFEVPDLSEQYIPAADVIIAGYVWMLDALARYGKTRGRRFYLVQGYELDDAANRERYLYPVTKIAISSTLKKRIRQAMKGRPVGEIPMVNNGVDLKLFSAAHRPRRDHPRRIGMVYYYKAPYAIKAVSDGIKAFEAARSKFSYIDLVMFGARRDRGVPGYAEFHAAPSREKIAEIYRGCDIFLSPSRQDACQLPPMEAMACGCALVTTEVGGVPDYTVPGETALTAPAGDIAGLAAHIETLLRYPEKYREIAEAGNRHIAGFAWDKMSARLEEVLLREPKEQEELF